METNEQLVKKYQEYLNSGINYDEMMNLIIMDYEYFTLNEENKTNIQTVFNSEEEYFSNIEALTEAFAINTKIYKRIYVAYKIDMEIFKRDFSDLRKELLEEYKKYLENEKNIMKQPTIIKSESDADRYFKALYLAYDEVQKNTTLD